jgi:hypothetical protein
MYTQEKADAICAHLAGGLSLRKACGAEGGPDPSTILRWTEENQEFAQQYACARARGYQLLADEIIEISDDSSGDLIETDAGPRVDAERVARSKLRVDSRKWMLSKMLPKLYGDKLDLNHAGDVNHSVKITFG